MIHSNTIKKILLSLALGLISFTAKAQNFDYQQRPTFNFHFDEANIKLQVDPQQGAVAGSVRYLLTANIDDAQQLTLNAPGIAIDSMRSGAKSVEFTHQNDSLQVALTDSSRRGQQYQLKIYYHAIPNFGLVKSSEESVWTSLLPRSVRHWLPVRDHPRVNMTTTLSLQIPAEYDAFASGVKTGEATGADSTHIVTFRTGRPIPITALSFGLGRFREQGGSVGIKQIKSYSEPNSIPAGRQRLLVDKAKEIIRNIAGLTGFDYPYQRLNLVILGDHHWEEKPYGAATVYLFKNRGDWIGQLRRGLYGQWLGVYRHEDRWAEAGPIHFLQALLNAQLKNTPATIKENVDTPAISFSTVYNNFSAGAWNFWQQFAINKFSGEKKMSAELLSQLLDGGAGIITTETLNDAWYGMTGQPTFNLPSAGTTSSSNTASAGSDSVRYRVDYTLSQPSNRLLLQFKAEKGQLSKPAHLPIRVAGGGKPQPASVTLSASADSVSIAIPAGTQNIYLTAPGGRKLGLDEHKPVPFLLYQLRNAKSEESRADAARQLGEHTDDPDLQLALNNALKKDTDPRVKAALLASYGKITNGAKGTENQFLDALNSDNPGVQRAALNALNNYKGQSITRKIQDISKTKADSVLWGRAMGMYLHRVDSSRALEYANTLVQQDTAGTRAIMAVSVLADMGQTKNAVKYAGFYIRPVYDYGVRRQALRILIHADSSAKNWKKRLDMLINDPDPRIRYLTAKNINNIPGVNANAVIRSRLKKEYDARVYKELGRK